MNGLERASARRAAHRVTRTTILRLTLIVVAGAAVTRGDDRAGSSTASDRRDEVVLRTDSGGYVVQRGTILDFKGKTLTLQTSPSGPTKSYAADRVVSVTTPQLGLHTRGERALREGRYADAANELELALDAEARQWVRRDILALRIRVALAQGDGRTARVRFGLLLESDPATRHFHLIPLAWAPTTIDPATASEARTLLVDDREAMRLVGASLLLEHPAGAAESGRMVRRLASSTDERIRDLAHAQQWRTRIGELLTGREVERWEYHVDRLPENLRAGPSHVVGRGHARTGSFDEAAIAFLWTPLVAPHDRVLAARCLVDAGDALRRIGKHNQAFGLYREAVANYGDTPFAADARSAIEEMTTGFEFDDDAGGTPPSE